MSVPCIPASISHADCMEILHKFCLQLEGKELSLDSPWIDNPQNACVQVEIRKNTIHLFGINSGLAVTFKQYYLDVYIDASIENQTEGLCGDHDNNRRNEFRKRGGEMASSVVEFGNSWQVDDQNDPKK